MSNRNGLTANSSSKSGFSLVEMALALGIAGFALIAIMGLLTANIQSSISAKEETVTADMVQDVLGDLKTQKTFATLQANLTANAYIYYFDADGNLLPSSGGAVYMCTVGLAAAVPPNAPATWSATSITPPLIAVNLKFNWPVSAPSANQLIINATIAQF